jgi:hypothetical protein
VYLFKGNLLAAFAQKANFGLGLYGDRYLDPILACYRRQQDVYAWATGANGYPGVHGRSAALRDRPYPIPVYLNSDRAPEDLNRNN